MADDQSFGLLCEVARRELVHILESLPGDKDLVVDGSLLRPLDRIASMSLLQQHGCKRVMPIRGDAAIPWDTDSRRVYLLRANFQSARMLAMHVRASSGRKVAVIWVDRKLVICERELEHQGVYGEIESFELNFCLLPLETDLFSLELPASPYVDLYAGANALFQLQSLYGLIPTIYGLGEETLRMWKLLKMIYADRGEPRASPDQPISHLFVFDRSLDRASIFLTGLTYESMLHDVFGIVCGKISFGPEVEAKMKTEPGPSGDDAKPKKSRVFVLDNNDGVFATVRNKHMTGVFPYLSSKAKEIQSTFNKGTTIDQIKEMKNFVSNELKIVKQQHKQLEMHICACEVLLEKTGAIGAGERLTIEHALLAGTVNMNELLSHLEDSILREQSPWNVLSLACLASLALNGLPSKIFTQFRDCFMRAYGYEYIPVIHTLGVKKLLVERANLVSQFQDKLQIKNDPSHVPNPDEEVHPTFPYICKRLMLTPTVSETGEDFKNPVSMNYVFSGAYTPVCCQVVASTMVHGWKTKEMEKTFGQVLVEENSYMPADRKPDNRIRKAILVFFLGGVTYAEVAALRLLAQQNNFRILIAATNVLQREQYMRTMGEVDAVPL